MPANSIPEPSDLPKKPLVEAIFQLQWSLQQQGPLAADPGFPLFQGRYYDRIREKYPFAVPLPAAAVPEPMTAHTVRQQFRAGEKQWPVTQIGPGILTVNETTNYRWQTFLPLIRQAINALFDAYPTDIAELKPREAQLRYINAIDLAAGDTPKPLLVYLKENLHTALAVEPLLFEDPEQAQRPDGLNITLVYQLINPEAVAAVTFTNGEVNGKPSLLFEITVKTTPGKTPGSPDAFFVWLESAHRIVDKWFFALTRGSLLEEFQKSDEN